MLRICLLALAGAAGCLALPQLPSLATLHGMLVLAASLALPRRTRPLAALLAGFAWAGQAAGTALADRLDPAQDGVESRFIAQITDFPQELAGRVRLVVAPQAAASLPRRVRLSWYDRDDEPAGLPRLGERWQFTARLKRPRGSRNPGGFDYAGWLHRQGIGASGYVIAAKRMDDAASRRDRLRRRLAERIEALLPAGDARAALMAIAIGARHRVTQEAWQRFAVTGTSHLMAISGLHVGLAAGGAAVLAIGLLAVFRPRGNLRDTATVAGALVAAGYAALSGFAVPAQRALVMTLFAAFALLTRRLLPVPTSLSLVALLVVFADPLAMLAPGFWLSFGAVALLLQAATVQQAGPVRGARAWLTGLGRLQLLLLLGLLPLTVTLFGRLSWVAPVANALVLPLFSLLTVPAALLGLALTGPFTAAGDALLWLAWYSLQAVMWLLERLALLPYADLQLARPRGPAMLLLFLPLLAVLLPRGMPGRALGWLGLVAVFLWRAPPPPAGCADLHLLDVGQGLAAILRTQRRVLLFDSGPAWQSGGNSGERTVLPFLRSIGVRRAALLIVSHADQDHAGGAGSIVAGLPVDAVLAGEPLDSLPALPCRAGQLWSWDGVRFRFLHPDHDNWRGNDASCVLEIATGDQRLLLTGDIERRVERRLLGNGMLQPAAVALVPHHGSRTSSSPGFVRALQAEVALVPAGYGNRWGFPKDDVVARWEDAGAVVLNAATSGAIHYRVCPGRPPQKMEEYRRAARRYWHDVEP